MQRFKGVLDEVLKASVIIFVCTLAVIASRGDGDPVENSKVADAVQTDATR